MTRKMEYFEKCFDDILHQVLMPRIHGVKNPYTQFNTKKVFDADCFELATCKIFDLLMDCTDKCVFDHTNSHVEAHDKSCLPIIMAKTVSTLLTRTVIYAWDNPIDENGKPIEKIGSHRYVKWSNGQESVKYFDDYSHFGARYNEATYDASRYEELLASIYNSQDEFEQSLILNSADLEQLQYTSEWLQVFDQLVHYIQASLFSYKRQYYDTFDGPKTQLTGKDLKTKFQKLVNTWLCYLYMDGLVQNSKMFSAINHILENKGDIKPHFNR